MVLGLIFSTKKVSEYYSIFAQVSQLEEKQNKLQETLAELEKKAEQVKAKKSSSGDHLLKLIEKKDEYVKAMAKTRN